jgi:hypothetical protein
MTIGTAGARVTQNCDGVSKVFPVAIQAYQATDLSVILTAPASAGGGQSTLVLNSDYSLATSGTLQPPAWTLTTLAAPAYAAGYTLQVFINPVQQQQTQYVQGQAFPSLAIQTNIDRLTQMVQRLQDQVNRSLRAPDGDVAPAMLLPNATQRALMYQAYDATGQPTLAALSATVMTWASVIALLGNAPANTWEPNWGTPDVHVVDTNGNNAIIGSIRQTTNFTGANGNFPTGVTGYGRMDGTGNQAFGVYGQADLMTTGTATNEFDSFNRTGVAPTGLLPPNLSFGTTDRNAIALQVAAYGTAPSSIGFNIGFGSQKFLCGIYLNFNACQTYGLYIDSGSAAGPTQPLVVKGQTGVVPVTIQTVGAFNANNSVLSVLDGLTSAVRYAIKQDGHPAYSAFATAATAGVNGALPAQVRGYFIAEEVGGALVKIPYYNT